MTNKTAPSKLKLDTLVEVEAPAPAAPALPAKRPYAVSVTGPMYVAMPQAAALVRQGYTFCVETPMQVFGHTGMVSLTMVLGNPDQTVIDSAAALVADAAALEEAAYRKDVEQAAARQIKEAAEAVVAAKKAALLAEQKRQLATIEAEIAALSK